MGHTHRHQFCFKKKNQVKSPSPESRVPETGSDPSIGSGRDSGRDTREMERMRPQPSTRGGMYSIPEDMNMKAKVSTLARRLEELEMRNQHEVQVVTEIPVPNKPCFICHSTEHLLE